MMWEISPGKQVVVRKGLIMIWANGGCIGVGVPDEIMREIGLTAFQLSRKPKEKAKP